MFLKRGFKKDLNLKDATERRRSIIGEAAKNISLDFKEKYFEIDWRVIAGTREIMVHAYFSVDLNQVWEIVIKDIPLLKNEIENILKDKNL